MLNLYKMQGNFIYCFVGRFGVGKTLGLLEQGIKMANYYNLKLVTNFPINQKYLKEYCKKNKYKQINFKYIDTDNFLKLNEDDQLEFLENQTQFSRKFIEENRGQSGLLYLFQQEKSIICLDEAGLKLFARNFKEEGRNDLFVEMFQLRKNRSFIFYSCQYINQVDKQLRDNTHMYIYCRGNQSFNRKKGYSVLKSRSVIAFTKEQFEMFMSKPEKQNKTIYPLYLSGWTFSWSNLILSKFLGYISHSIKSLKLALKKSKDKSVFYRLFWIAEYVEEYFTRLDWISEEDLLFKIYDSFGKVGKGKGKAGIFQNSKKNNEYENIGKEDTPKPENGQMKNNHELEWLKQL
jgi:hypothetical protein